MTSVPDTYTTATGWNISDPVKLSDIPANWKSIGRGSSRQAFLTECGKVVKILIHNPYLNQQCVQEKKIWENACDELRPHLAELYAAGETFCVMEYVERPSAYISFQDNPLRKRMIELHAQGKCDSSLTSDCGSDNMGQRADGTYVLVDYGYYC